MPESLNNADNDLSGLSDAELREAMFGYLTHRGQYRNDTRLITVPRERTMPFLIEMVNTIGSEFPAPDDKSRNPATPLRSALVLIEPGTQPQILSRLLELSRSTEPTVRENVADHLTAFASDEVVPAVLDLLSEGEKNLSASIITGIRMATKHGNLSLKFREALFEPVAKINLHGLMMTNAQGDALLALDREKGAKMLKGLIPVNNLQSSDAFGALSRAGIIPDAEVLVRLLRENEAYQGDERWRSGFFDRLLFSLAKAKHPEAHRAVERNLPTAGNIPIHRQIAATRALLILLDFKMSPLEERLERLDRSGLTKLERCIHFEIEHKVCISGLVTYFEEVKYDPREEVEDLERLGALGRADIIQRSFECFGPAGPAPDLVARAKQLEEMSQEDQHRLYMFEREWNNSWESLNLLLNLYLLENHVELQALE